MASGGVPVEVRVMDLDEALKFLDDVKATTQRALQEVNNVAVETVSYMQAAVHVNSGDLKASINNVSLANDEHYVAQEITAPATNKSGQEYAIYEEQRGNSHAFFTTGFNFANDLLYGRVSAYVNMV